MPISTRDIRSTVKLSASESIPLLPVSFDAAVSLKQPYELLSVRESPSSPIVASGLEVGLALFSYCVASIIMTLTTKCIFSELQFSMNFLLLTVQSLVCAVMLMLLKRMKLLHYRSLNWRDICAWTPVSLLLVAMIYTGSKSIQYLPISIFTIFKNMTIVLIAYGDCKFFRGVITPLMIILSSVLGALGDLQFHIVGYAWILFNCLCSAGYVLCMRARIRQVQFQDFDTVYYNNVMTVPILCLCSLLVEDWSTLSSTFYDAHGVLRRVLLVAIALSSVATFMISYGAAWSIRVASSTTYSMAGALNKLPIAVSGILFLPSEKHVSVLNLSSIFIAFLSGLLYSYAQWQHKKSTSRALGLKV